MGSEAVTQSWHDAAKRSLDASDKRRREAEAMVARLYNCLHTVLDGHPPADPVVEDTMNEAKEMITPTGRGSS